MRVIMSDGHFDLERLKLPPPVAWAIGAAAIVSVFAIVAIMVNYASLNRDTTRRIENQFPPATYGTLSALIKTSGNACEKICSVDAVNTPLSTSTSIEVACAAPVNGCLTPQRYRINVQTTAEPQR